MCSSCFWGSHSILGETICEPKKLSNWRRHSVGSLHESARLLAGVAARNFRLWHFDVVTAIDADLAREIKRARITGPQFYPIE